MYLVNVLFIFSVKLHQSLFGSAPRHTFSEVSVQGSYGSIHTFFQWTTNRAIKRFNRTKPAKCEISLWHETIKNCLSKMFLFEKPYTATLVLILGWDSVADGECLKKPLWNLWKIGPVPVPTIIILATWECVYTTGNKCKRLLQIWKMLNLNALNAL